MTRRSRMAAAGAVSLTVLTLLQGFAPDAPDGTVTVREAAVDYRMPGEFLDRGAAVDAPRLPIRLSRPIAIQRRQVTRGEYDACVAAGGCRPLDETTAPELPAVGLSHLDAEAYAAWYSAKTGRRWRLPTDREWALAAGTRYADEAELGRAETDDPSRRWLAAYEAESNREGAESTLLRPAGGYGENEHGLVDLAGNVWEWTSTCYTRVRLEAVGEGPVENCGVRVVQGRHRSYMTGFIRDPKGGACSTGTPPAHLGLRLVREETGLMARLGL